MIDKQPWNCSVCEKSFAKFSHLTKHMEDHHQFDESAVDNGSKQNSKNAKVQGSKYKCKVCQEVFPDESLLVTHSCAGRPAPKIYKCKTCPKEFLYMCKLVQHERIHVMDKPYKCAVCYCSFSQACHLGRHMQTHSASANNKCIVCSKVFKNSALLQKHKLIHNTEKVFKCDLCPHTFTDLSQLTTHLNGHMNDQEVSFGESTKSGVLETLETKSTAGSGSIKKAKKRKVASDRKWNFRSCRARSSTMESSRLGKGHNIFKMAQENLKVSSDSQESEKSVAESESGAKYSLETASVFHCDICKKAFSRKEEFEAHLESHTMKERQQYVCEICRQCFVDYSLYELHVKNDHWEKKILPNGKESQQYACEICQQCFVSSSLYELHMKNDHQEKKIMPNGINGLCMSRPSLFEKFESLSSPKAAVFTKISSQSGISHFTSTPKPAIFLVNSEKSLNFTKLGEDTCITDFPAQAERFLDDNFRCLICNKNFANSFTLDLHLEKHIIVKTLPRNRHTIWSIHFPQKKFYCKICQKSFSQRMILQGHSKIMHRGPNKKPIEL